MKRWFTLFTMCVFCTYELFVQPPHVLGATKCSNNSSLSQSAIGRIANGKAPDQNGIVHVTYSTDIGYIDPAITNAFNAWNKVSGQTGLSFDPVQGSSDIQLSSNGAQGTCIYTTTATGAITYDSHFATSLKGGTQAPFTSTVLSFEHEIGHMIGLDDNPAGTNQGLMDQSHGCIPGDRNYSWDAKPVTVADATPVSSCVATAKKLCVRCKHQ